MSILDKNLVETKIVHGDVTLDALLDSQIILDDATALATHNITLPAGKNNLCFRFGVSNATTSGGALWTLVPNGSDVVDSGIGTIGGAPKAIVFKNGKWYLV